MKIYVITHKKFEEKCKSSVYQPILVGAALHDIDVSERLNIVQLLLGWLLRLY